MRISKKIMQLKRQPQTRADMYASEMRCAYGATPGALALEAAA
jgi:hypothetical protein